MAQIDTRHSERTNLFLALKAKYENDIDSAILTMIAAMEESDVESVKKTFETWKESRESRETKTQT